MRSSAARAGGMARVEQRAIAAAARIPWRRRLWERSEVIDAILGPRDRWLLDFCAKIVKEVQMQPEPAPFRTASPDRLLRAEPLAMLGIRRPARLSIGALRRTMAALRRGCHSRV